MAAQQKGEVSPLIWVWFVLNKHRTTVGVIAAAIVMASIVTTLTSTKYYSAQTTIEIQPNAPTVLDVEAVTSVGATHWDVNRYYRTQYRIITSQSVMEEAGIRILTQIDPEILGGVDPADYLAGGVSVVPEVETNLVKIIFVDPDPDFAAIAANTIADTYIDLNVQRVLDASSQALDWLQEQQQVYRDLQNVSDQRVQEFKSEHGLVGSRVEEQSSSMEMLVELQGAWSRAHTHRLQADSEIGAINEAVKREGYAAVANTLADKNPVLLDTLTRLEEVKSQRARLSSRYLDEHPKLVQTNEEVSQLEQELGNVVTSLIASKRAAAKMALSNEEVLKKELDHIEDEVGALSETLIDYNFLLSETERNKSLFNSLDDRLAEVGLTKLLPVNNIHSVDKAQPIYSPVRPVLMTNLMLGFLIGILSGAAVAFIKEYFDHSVKSRGDVEGIIGAPFLGTLPKIQKAQLEGLTGASATIVAYSLPRSTVAEAFRLIRNAITFSDRHQKPIRSLLVSSAVPKEGKSFVSANLAAIMAMGGQRVLVIDADMRRPTMHRLFGIENRDGLGQVLSREARPVDTIIKTIVPGLDLLPAGTGVEAPAELLDRASIMALLSQLSQYDMIIIDSPPVNVVGDAMVLASVVDGVVFVIESDKTNKTLASTGCERLASVNDNLIGAIVNKLDLSGGQPYGYGYGYRYGYDYSYNYGYYQNEQNEQNEQNDPKPDAAS